MFYLLPGKGFFVVAHKEAAFFKQSVIFVNAENLVHFLDLPRLDRYSMKPREKSEARCEVLKNCVVMQLALLVVDSGKDDLFV